MDNAFSSLSAASLDDLARLRAECGSASLTHLRQHTAVLKHYQAWCRRALAASHLVTVASALCRERHTSLDDLEAIGIPVDLLEQFPSWPCGSRAGFRPTGFGLTPARSGAGEPIGALRVQLSPASGTIPYALILLRALLRCVDPSVRFTIVVEPGANLAGLRQLVGRFDRRAAQRCRFVEMPCSTVFAQDNARAARDAQGNPVLLIPRAFRQHRARGDDALSPKEAERAFGLPVIRSRLYWEGGNILHDADCCLIGVDTIAENMVRLGLGAQEVLAIFSAELGGDVVPLGDLSRARWNASTGELEASGQASFHIDMDVSLLGTFGRNRRPRALVADAARGLDFLPAILERQELFENHFVAPDEARQFIAAEYEAFARQRHPQLLAYSETLEALGYRVVGLPDLRLDPKENVFQTVNLDFSYCNVLPGLWRGRPAIHYLPWGYEPLDGEAAHRFRLAGVEPVPFPATHRAANALMCLSGGLHCFCGPLPYQSPA